jgi:hypothetical protein
MSYYSTSSICFSTLSSYYLQVIRQIFWFKKLFLCILNSKTFCIHINHWSRHIKLSPFFRTFRFQVWKVLLQCTICLREFLELRRLPMLIKLIEFFAVNTNVHLIFFIVFLSILAWTWLNPWRSSFCLFFKLLLIKLFFKLIHLGWFSQKCKFTRPIFAVFKSFTWIWLSSSL